jgi:hypothetical protein
MTASTVVLPVHASGWLATNIRAVNTAGHPQSAAQGLAGLPMVRGRAPSTPMAMFGQRLKTNKMDKQQ